MTRVGRPSNALGTRGPREGERREGMERKEVKLRKMLEMERKV